MTYPSECPDFDDIHVIRVGDLVNSILGRAKVLKIDLYDGGRASGVYLGVMAPDGRSVGMIGGSIEGLGVTPLEEQE